MPASKLTAMAQRVAIRNLARIDDFDGIPFKAIKPILERIENPDHLRQIEKKCPEIADESADLWQNFIIRDIPNGKEKMLYPKNPRSWHKVYAKMMRDEAKRKAEAEDALRNTMLGLAGQKKETQILNKVVPHQTRPKDFVDGVPNIRSGSTRVKYEGVHGKLNTIKRPASHFATQKVFAQKLNRNNIPDIRDQIKVAPKSMLREYQNPASVATMRAAEQARKYAEPKSQIQKVFAPTIKRSVTDRAIDEAKWKEQQEREQRLRNLTKPGTNPLPSAAAPQAGTTTTATTITTTRATTAASPPPRASIETTSARPAAAAVPKSSPTKRLPPVRRLSPPTTASTPVKRQATPASSPSPPKSTPPPPMRRKRPAADPFMPATKRVRP